AIRRLIFSVPRAQAIDFGRARLRITWDGLSAPSVDAPIALFYGAGTLYNRDNREYLVKAFPSYIRFTEQKVELACFFPMPFFRSARIELIGSPSNAVNDITFYVGTVPFKGQPAEAGYFHATYRDHPNPEPGKDLVLLDTRQVEGGGDGSGHLGGTSWMFEDGVGLSTREADPRVCGDGSRTPRGPATGPEWWGGGSGECGGAQRA